MRGDGRGEGKEDNFYLSLRPTGELHWRGAINPAQGLSRLTDVIIKLNGRVGRFEGGRELYGCRCNLIRYEAALA